MLLFKVGVVFLCMVAFADVLKSVDGVRTVDRSLFFSAPLPDSLGKFQDQQKVTLSCSGGSRNGQPITYKWLKNGRVLDTIPIRRYTATISGELMMYPSNYRDDNGYYQCMVTDKTVEKWSLLSNSAELQIAYLSGVTKGNVIESGQEWQPWKYVFTGYGHSHYPRPTFIWKFKGTVLKETERISISENGDLYIAQLNINDAGKYSCEINNQFKKQTRELINLKIVRSTSTSDVQAVFTLGPKNRIVSLKRESEVTFECFASAKPMPKITWKKNGILLNNGAKYVIKNFGKRLTVRYLDTTDSGKYQCDITRATVKSSSEAFLTVIDPPTIQALEPKNQIGHIGNYTTLTCMVAGSFQNVHFTQSWYRNGVRLYPSSSVFMRSRTFPYFRNYTLNVTNLRKYPDGGMYQCFATNDGGQVMEYASIDVQILPPNITYGPGVVYAVLGRQARIRCIARGSPPITFTWQKNGVLIRSDNGKNGTYVIQIVRKTDVAQYTCVARNGPREIDVAKSTGVLEIVGATVVENKSSIVYASKGSHPYLYCGVRFDRKVNVTYRWYFKGYLILRGGRREVKYDGRLVIKGVSEQDGGIYRCEAISVVGNYSTTIELIVQAPPFVTTSPQVDEIRPHSVRLLWKSGYDGNSAIHYFIIGLKYVSNDTEVDYVNLVMPSGDIKKFVVSGLMPSTQYQFRVRAVNAVGKGPWSQYSKKITTREAAPMYRLQKVSGKPVADDTIDIEWEIPPKHTHNGVLLGYYVAWKYAGVTSGQFTTRKVTPATMNQIRITNLILNSPYEVKVQMFNKAGAGPFSAPVVVRTQEGIPSSPPRNLAVRNVSSRSVLLEWDAPPQQDWNGEITNYIIRLWKFDKIDDIDRRNAFHDTSAFIQSHNVTKLNTYTQYVFTVSAHNSQGGSVDSNQVQVKTTEDIPSAPQRLTIVDQFSDTISVSWVRPREVNGVLVGYVVKYWRIGSGEKPSEITVSGHALQAGITSLRSKTRYMIDVAAKTRVGISRSARIEGRTLDVPVPPHPPTQLRFLEINATAIELTWVEGSKGRSPIISYIIEGNNETGFANDKTSQWFNALIVKHPYKIYNLPPVLIENLNSDTVYRFRVRAVNKVGASPLSMVSSDVRTAEDVPSSPPIGIRVESTGLNPGELLLRWQTPPKETWNSPFITYTVILEEVGKEDNFSRPTASGIRSQARTKKLTSLKKYTLYKIRMKTSNRIGDSPYSPTIIGQTQEYVPDVPPANIRAIGASGSSINITWDVVDEDGRNGFVLGYKIFYALFQYAVQEFTEMKLGNVTSYVLTNLLGYTQYDIRVLAFTKIGDGKRSDALRPYPRTLETKPGPPSRLHFPVIDASLVIVSWDVPELLGGNITMYRINYKLRDEVRGKLVRVPTLDSTRRKYTVVKLAADKYYIFEVEAFTSVGWGTPARAEIYTSRDGNKGTAETPLILPIADSHVTSRSIKLRWAVVTRRRQPIRYFTLELRKAQGAWQTHPKPLGGSDKELVVWGLEPDHLYRFRIKSTIDGDTSPFSKPSPLVRTLRESGYGSPREVRIISHSPTTLTVSWKPPSLVDIQATIRYYRLGYREHVNNPTKSSGYLEVFPSSTQQKYTIIGLQEYTLYDISLNAVDEFQQDLSRYLETRRTAARIPPRPSLRKPDNIGPTSVTLFWDRQNLQETSILGYKAIYKNLSNKRRRRRRRRFVSEVCDVPEPGAAYFSNTSTQGTITNLNMYTNYRFVLRAYNSAGDSPDSAAVTAKTSEGVPGPPATFGFDGVYGNEVDLYWEPPCEPNGRLLDYKLTVRVDAKGIIEQTKLDSHRREYKVQGLSLLTKYTFELVAITSQGEGTTKILKTRTTGPPVKPDPPTSIKAVATHNTVTLTWRDGFNGNSPLTLYIVESKTSSDKSPWVVGWSLTPSETRKNRTAGTLWVVLDDLKPNTIYWFRISVANQVDKSLPSDSSNSVVTGPAVYSRESPIYEKIWFISVMVIIGLLILILLIVCIVCICRRRSKKSSGIINHTTVELSSLQNSRGLRLQSSSENLSNGGVRSEKDERPLVDESDQEREEDEDEDDEEEVEEEDASSLETKSDMSQSESEDDIPTKKRQLKEALEEQDKYHPHSKPRPRSFSFDNVQGSPPPAYATFASRNAARSVPSLDPYKEFDDDDDSGSSGIQNRKRDDPRSSSFRRALFSGKPDSEPQPEPERPIGHKPEPARRPKPTPRKYRSLEKAVNDAANPPSYEDDDDDDVDNDNIDVDVRQPGLSRRFTSPPDYRSDSGRDSSDDHDRVPLTQPQGGYDASERSDSPAPAYQSSNEDSSENPDRHHLINGEAQPEISAYSSFV